MSSCNLKLYIPVEKVNEILSELVNDFEISGVISCKSSDDVDITINKGNKDSVMTPNHVINYHTHPVSAYNEGDTTWGWPSGEDVRETMKFALAGNKAHLVFTVEGVYTMQVSPCKIKKMKNLLTNEQIGVLIFLIEEYFKTTHNFRGVDDVNVLSDKKIIITPSSFVDFINNFDLKNLTNAKTIFHTKSKHNVDSFGERFTRIPNIGFPDLDGYKITNLPIKNYIKYNELEELRSINKDGREYKSSIKKIDHLLKVFDEILKIFNTNECKMNWNNKPNSWFFVNFFPSKYYLSKKIINNGSFISPKKDLSLLKLEEPPYIKIFSNKVDGCSTEEIRKINKFEIIRKSNKHTHTGTHRNNFGKNTFGESDLTSQQIILLIQNMDLNPNESIFNVAKKLNISDSQINTFLKKFN